MSALPFASAEQMEKIAPLMVCHYYCVVPETPVLTADMEWLPAGKLNIGDEVVGVDEFPESYGDRRFRRAVVTGNARRIMECVLVRLEDGREVTCSLDHPWLLKTERRPFISKEGFTGHVRWIEAARLRVGDKISSPIRVWERETSFEAGWLAGMFDGEGSAGRYGNRRYASTSLSVAQNPGPVLDRMKAVLDAMGIRYNESKNACNSNVTKLRLCTMRRHAGSTGAAAANAAVPGRPVGRHRHPHEGPESICDCRRSDPSRAMRGRCARYIDRHLPGERPCLSQHR